MRQPLTRCEAEAQPQTSGVTELNADWLGGGRARWRWKSCWVAALAVLPRSSVLRPWIG